MGKVKAWSPTRIIVCGGRDLNNAGLVYCKLDELIRDKGDVHFVLGGCKGADAIAKMYAIENDIPYTEFVAKWKEYGSHAGPIRNTEMLNFALQQEDSVVIGFWDGESKGTNDMLTKGRDAGVEVIVVNYTKGDLSSDDWE